MITGLHQRQSVISRCGSIEWITLFLIIACYAAWMLATLFASNLGILPSWIILAFVIALHSSLQHEVLHGHPTRFRWFNESLVFVPIGLFIPYQRFRQTHLKHHVDPNLTDPYEDPESNYLDPAVWNGLSEPAKFLLRCNNTLAGRMAIGPALSIYRLYKEDMHSVARGSREILHAHLLHLAGLVLVLVWLSSLATISVWAYLLAAYSGLSLLKIRTFLEHRAFETVPGRIVIIEQPGLFSWLFLNNNLHAVHHTNPGVAWYRLPEIYRSGRKQFLQNNSNYCYASYAEVFRKYFFTAKDPVAHPLYKRRVKHL